MGLRVSSVFLCVLLLARTTLQTDYVAGTGELSVSDSAQAELAAGRFWHAARLLRAEGAENGSPDDILILAKAEAGWENWAAVVAVLSGVSWLEEKMGGEGFVLLGRAHEHAEDWASAASSYQTYLRLAGADDTTATSVRVRLARSLWLAGDREGSLATIRDLRSVPHARSWLAAELALVAADYGDVDGVRLLLRQIVEPAAVADVWRVEADALIELGDHAAAERVVRGAFAHRQLPTQAPIVEVNCRAGTDIGEVVVAHAVSSPSPKKQTCRETHFSHFPPLFVPSLS